MSEKLWYFPNSHPIATPLLIKEDEICKFVLLMATILFLPLQDGQQMPRLGSGGFGSVQLRAGHCGGRHETTPCWNQNEILINGAYKISQNWFLYIYIPKHIGIANISLLTTHEHSWHPSAHEAPSSRMIPPGKRQDFVQSHPSNFSTLSSVVSSCQEIDIEPC